MNQRPAGPQPLMNYSEVLVALGEVERSAGNFLQRSVVRGLLLGPPICLVACIGLGNLLVLAGPHRAQAFSSSLSGLMGVYGFFLGLFLGPIVDAIVKDKRATEQMLAKMIVRLNVSANDVGRVLHDHEPQLPKSAGAYARLMKRKKLQ